MRFCDGMSLKRKAFVISLGKAHADIEVGAYKAYKEGRAPIPDVKKLVAQKGVKETAKGIIVDTRRASENTSGLLKVVSAMVVHPLAIQRQNAERLALIKQLAELGFRVAVPNLKLNSPKMLSRASKHAKVFSVNPPVIAEHNGMKEYPASIAWLRDMWVHDGKKRVMRYSKNKEVAPFGEGGMSVRFGKCVFASDKLRNDASVKKMSSQGFRFYFLGDGENYYSSLSKILRRKTYLTMDHVDLFVGVVGRTMLVEEDFYKSNQGVLREAVRENKLKVLFVPKGESDFHPSNFLVLGDNKVLVDRQAKQTIDLLKSQGIEAIPTRVPMRANLAAGGGVRCIVNEL